MDRPINAKKIIEYKKNSCATPTKDKKNNKKITSEALLCDQFV